MPVPYRNNGCGWVQINTHIIFSVKNMNKILVKIPTVVSPPQDGSEEPFVSYWFGVGWAPETPEGLGTEGDRKRSRVRRSHQRGGAFAEDGA